MPLVSDPSNQRSTFPPTLDTFNLLSDGRGNNSVINAEIFNKIETCILRLEDHTKKVVHIAEGGSRRRLIIQAAVAIPAAVSITGVVLTLSPAQLTFLNNQPFQSGTLILAHVYKLGTGEGYLANVTPTGTNQIRIDWDKLNRSTNVEAGDYRVQITFITG